MEVRVEFYSKYNPLLGWAAFRFVRKAVHRRADGEGFCGREYAGWGRDLGC